MIGEKIRTGMIYIDGQPFDGSPDNNSSFTSKQRHILRKLQKEVQHLNSVIMIDTHGEDGWVFNGGNTRNGRIITHTIEW